MDEARRFLRYVTPGLAFLIEIVSLLFIAQPSIMLDHTRTLGGNPSLSLPFTALIASGGIGYVLSLIHHFLFWHFYARREWISLLYDFRDILNALKEKKHLEFIDQRGEDKNSEDITLENAWIIVCSIWHERKEDSTKIKSADNRITSLTDIMHGAGTSFIGSFFVVITWFSIQLIEFEAKPLLWVVPIAVLLVFVHLRNYMTTVKQCQSVIEIVFADELANPSNNFSHPYKVRLCNLLLKK